MILFLVSFSHDMVHCIKGNSHNVEAQLFNHDKLFDMIIEIVESELHKLMALDMYENEIQNMKLVTTIFNMELEPLLIMSKWRKLFMLTWERKVLR